MAKASTQSFTQLKEIQGNVVLFKTNHACLVIELTATNFSLLSPQEQDAKILAFSALLNSLSFPIQIVIRSRKLDISNYLSLLDQEAGKAANSKFSEQIKKYKEFVGQMVKVNTILDKKFYIVIPFSGLENPKAASQNFNGAALAALHSKASSLSSLLQRLNLRARILEEEELVKLFYEVYNER